MVEYDPNADGNAESDKIYLKPTKYVLGDQQADGHIHVFYLRDDLPIATTTSKGIGPNGFPHAHSIEEGPGKTVISLAIDGHNHSLLTVDEPGNYEIRTLFTG